MYSTLLALNDFNAAYCFYILKIFNYQSDCMFNLCCIETFKLKENWNQMKQHNYVLQTKTYMYFCLHILST